MTAGSYAKRIQICSENVDKYSEENKLQQQVNRDFQMCKQDLEKAEEPEIKLPTSAGSLKKARLLWVVQSF